MTMNKPVLPIGYVNEEVKHNLDRFPADFLYQLAPEEMGQVVVCVVVELRDMLTSNQALDNRVHTLERKVSTHERNIAELVDSMAQLLHIPPEPPKRPIGFVTHEDKKDTPKGAVKAVVKMGRGKKT